MRRAVSFILAPIIAFPIPAVATSPAAAASRSAQPLPPDGVITDAGYYLLQHDLLVERETAIAINADNTTLDLGGNRVHFHGRPCASTFGIVVNSRNNVRITGGSIGGFWFNIHCTGANALRIDNVQCDGIPYIGANISGCRNVLLHANVFRSFRYDIPRPQNERYLIGINMSAENAVVCHNSFDLDCASRRPHDPPIEAVLTLLSADSQRCTIFKNCLEGTGVVPGSYGIWAASNAHVSILANVVRNMKYGVCLETGAAALVGFNEFTAETGAAGAEAAAFGLYAANANEVLVMGNAFEGIAVPILAPTKQTASSPAGR